MEFISRRDFLKLGGLTLAGATSAISLGQDVGKKSMPMTVFSGVLSGMLLLWFTGLLIK